MKRDLIMIAVITVLVVSLSILFTNSNTNPLVQVREKVLVTKPGTFPSTVRLVDPVGRTYCSGTVIAEDLVLTAAHCIMGASVVMSEPNKDGQVALVPSMPIVVVPRADYALLKGDFTGFTIMPTETDPEKDLLYNQTDLVSCGFPWGSSLTCYPILSDVKKMFEGFQAQGQMYPAMSGGPVIDIKTGRVVGVNHAIGNNIVLFMPLIGLDTKLREAEGR